MSQQETPRVLGRRGARELTIPELEVVGGAQVVHTNVCTAPLFTATHTGIADGDGCSDTDHSPS